MDGQPGPSRSPGLLASLRRLLATLVELLHTRFELIATEIAEERTRVTRLVIFAAIAAFFLSLGIVTLTLFIIILTWDSNRVLAAGALTALYLGAGIFCAMKAREAAREATKLFSASLAQLKKDRDALTS